MTLYRDEGLVHNEYMLDKKDSLNERHAGNIYNWKVSENSKSRAAALRLDNATQVPTWSEVQQDIEAMKIAEQGGRRGEGVVTG